MNREIIEILIGKHLDGEITPGEQRILEVELERDPRAKELLAELRDLHERSSEIVASCILGQGKAPRDVFEQAWQQAEHPVARRARRLSYAHVAVGVVAGFLMGLAVNFIFPGTSVPRNGSAVSDVFVRNVADPMELAGPALPDLPADLAGGPVRNVDWYNFTDKDGNQWLIEGLRENIAQPAAYYGDL